MCHHEYLKEVLQSEQDGNHIFRVKRKIGEIMKGVGNRSGSQDQSKVEKYKKARYAIGNISMKNLSNIIKDFEKMVKVPYVKRIPKHEPTSSYYHLVGCITECMLIFGEENQHVHSGYAEETAPSSKVNDTNEDKLKEFIVHKPLVENLSMDASESECNTVHENLSQNNSSDVTTNVITEGKVCHQKCQHEGPFQKNQRL